MPEAAPEAALDALEAAASVAPAALASLAALAEAEAAALEPCPSDCTAYGVEPSEYVNVIESPTLYKIISGSVATGKSYMVFTLSKVT